jgi:hypothetical protein
MAARQPSASFADRDATRPHGSMMTERPDGQWLAQAVPDSRGVRPVALRTFRATRRAIR